MRRLTKLGVVIASGLLAAACSSSNGGSSNTSPSGPSGVLSISNESGATWTCGFSPFNPAVSGLSFGPVYEPLVFVNGLQSGRTTPWLATSYKWSNGNKTLTFMIRKGVKFSDGSPMTAADVAFTYNMLKKFKALDLNSIWSVLSSVTQQGDNVVMNFKSAAVPYFYYIADQVGIVPMKIWSKITNPVNFADKNPVGTGAYTMKSCTPQLITYQANKNYYQPGEPHIATVLYPSYTSNDPANLDLATGKAQWGGQFIPSIKKFYTSKSPSYHFWFPPVANVSIFINLKDPILSDVKVRQALAYAIDRSKVSTVGEYGYEPASNQTGIVTPTYSSWVDHTAAAKFGNYSFNPNKAISILTSDGYKKDANGLMAKNGKELSFGILNQGGYSDWVASVQVIQQNLQAVGIKLTPINLGGTDYDNRVLKGQFQLAYDSETGGPSPYYELRQWLYGPNTAPIGQLATTNYERYSNPATDTLINSYGSTTNPAQQHAIVNQLEQVMLSQVPVIPVTESVDWFQYDTSKFSGWVTQQNPYAQPAPYSTPDWGIQLLHLKPAGG